MALWGEEFEKFVAVKEYLDYICRTLDSLSREIETEVNDIVDTTDVTVEYDIDSGSFQARLPVEEIAARVNQRLDPPFFVRLTERRSWSKISDEQSTSIVSTWMITGVIENELGQRRT